MSSGIFHSSPENKWTYLSFRYRKRIKSGKVTNIDTQNPTLPITMNTNGSNANKIQIVSRPWSEKHKSSEACSSHRDMSPFSRWLNQAPNNDPWNNIGAVSQSFTGNRMKSSQSCSEGAVWGSEKHSVSTKHWKQWTLRETGILGLSWSANTFSNTKDHDEWFQGITKII